MPRLDPMGDVLVRRVNRLFETRHPADRGPYSNADIADRATAHGYEISAAAIQQIRSGRRSNPTVRVLRGLAAAFDVPITYFFEDEAADTQSSLPSEVRARSGELSDRAAQLLADLVHELRDRPKT